ncbi:MAG: Neutral/alkaline non-lysosomal ceramidase, partial [Planctomycetaceae bacterium]|nr:Neutral/alkaline non-lysosomal ceramidase [Planctomycetaceae bacterium]
QLSRLDRGEALQSKLEYPIQTWSFGKSLAMVFLPGEVVVDYSLRLKRELDGQRLWITAYANDEPCYIPSERILQEGGYEGRDAMTYYDRPGPLQAGLEKQILDTIQAQIGAGYAAKFDAARTLGSMPKSPQQSLATLRTNPKLQVELVVAEPLIADPVAIDFGPDGDLWVAEMHDYPAGVSGDYQPGGRVRLVEDRDGDGRYDRSSVFLENIPFPTGITVWRDGVLVCAAPDILFARDTDGDGRADDIKKLYSGFGTGNFQARVNSLCYGLDGWVYGSCGLFGGKITNFKGQEFQLGDRDFRIKPDSGELEPATGRTQQGRVRDDWDNWFGCDNSNLCRHYPLADHYLRRNSHLVSPPSWVNVPNDANANRLFPVTKQVQRFKLSGPENNVTAACGLGIYRDTLLGSEYQGNAFTCEPVNLLVHRLQLTGVDCSFAGQRAAEEAESEFLAGTDDWFRPVQAKTGPDGGLWVVDMYRFVIEHPRWIPAETVAKLDVRAGHSLGRVYRVRPRESQRPATPNLHKLDGLGLASALETDNGWQRDLAGQMLIWKYSKGVVKSDLELSGITDRLTQIALQSKRSVARLQALCVLDLLDKATPAVNLQALSDPEPGVRRHAVRIAERQIGRNSELAQAIGRLTDRDAQVSLQQAYSLAALPHAESGMGLYKLAARNTPNPYLIAAVMSSLRKENVGPLLEAAIREPHVTEFHQRVFPAFVGQSLALGSSEHLPQVIEFITRQRVGGWQPWQFEGTAEILAVLRRQGLSVGKVGNATTQNAIRELLAKTLQLLQDEQTPLPVRISILQVLGQGAEQQTTELQVLGGLLRPQTDPELQSRIIETLGRIDAIGIPEILVSNWISLSPARQSQVLDLLLSRPAWTNALLGFVEEKKVAGNQIDAVRRQRLLTHTNVYIRVRSEKLLAGATNPDRVKVLESYRQAATLTGDPQRGQALFSKTCATCHRLGSIGQAVGPDLAALANKSPQFLLQEILDPNRNVDSRYVQYTVVLKDGRSSTGLLATESANSLTLKSTDGKEIAILRSDIEEIASTGKSLMPEGLERDLTPAAVADIIAFVTQTQSPAKPFPGNTPSLVSSLNGQFALLARHAEIRGGAIVFEEPFQNIGYWHSLQDYVTWNVKMEQSGEFDVYLDFACAADCAGNEFVLLETQPLIAGKVPSTGGWDRFRQQKMGTVSLAAGAHRLSIRPSGQAVHGALMDLKGVYLVPKGDTLVLAMSEPPPAPVAPVGIADLVAQILNDKLPQEKRQALITQNPKLAAELIAGLTADLTPGTPQEYQRIPWIWRVAIAAGKRNQIPEIRRILEVCMPQPNQPLHDWQAVVIGGGIINGISLEGSWPLPRMAEILRDQAGLDVRWIRTLEEAARMVDNDKVHNGTRYDALRIVALNRWERCGTQLEKYLAEGANAELQMGAVSGLADVDHAAATRLLMNALPHLVPGNRKLAVDALLRNSERQRALIEALENGSAKTAWLNSEQQAKLLKSEDAGWRERASKVLK